MFKILFLSLLAFFSSCASLQSEKKEPFTIGTCPTYFPFEFKNADGELDGFDIDLARALAEQMNQTLVIKEFDFDALILALEQGKIDAIISAFSITPSREEILALIPYQTNPTDHLILAFWDKIPDAIETIAAQVGTFQANYWETTQSIPMKTLQNNTDLLIDLKYGKSTAALLEPLVAKALKKKMPSLQLLTHPLPKELWAKGSGIALNKGNQELISKVDRALKQLQENNVTAALEEKWFGRSS